MSLAVLTVECQWHGHHHPDCHGVIFMHLFLQNSISDRKMDIVLLFVGVLVNVSVGVLVYNIKVWDVLSQGVSYCFSLISPRFKLYNTLSVVCSAFLGLTSLRYHTGQHVVIKNK